MGNNGSGDRDCGHQGKDYSDLSKATGSWKSCSGKSTVYLFGDGHQVAVPNKSIQSMNDHEKADSKSYLEKTKDWARHTAERAVLVNRYVSSLNDLPPTFDMTKSGALPQQVVMDHMTQQEIVRRSDAYDKALKDLQDYDRVHSGSNSTNSYGSTFPSHPWQ